MKGMMGMNERDSNFRGVHKSTNDQIVTYTALTDFGYILKYIENNDPNSSYLDYANYTKFKELDVLEPKSATSNKYCLKVRYNDP